MLDILLTKFRINSRREIFTAENLYRSILEFRRLRSSFLSVKRNVNGNLLHSMDKHRLHIFHFILYYFPAAIDITFLRYTPRYTAYVYHARGVSTHHERKKAKHACTCARVGELSCRLPMCTRPGTIDVKSTMLLDSRRKPCWRTVVDRWKWRLRARGLAVYIRLRKFTPSSRRRAGLGWKLPVVCNPARPGKGRKLGRFDCTANTRPSGLILAGIRENVYNFDHDRECEVSRWRECRHV